VAILKCYTKETPRQFATVIRTIIESSLAQALAASQKQMDGWLRGAAHSTGHSQRTRRPRGGDAGFPGQATRCLELRAVERFAGAFSVALAFSSWGTGWGSTCDSLNLLLKAENNGSTQQV